MSSVHTVYRENNLAYSMCRDILNTCVRNTEEAEKATQAKTDAASGRGQGKGVWGMIEDSELAKTLLSDDKKKVEAQIPAASSPTAFGEDETDVNTPLGKQSDSATVLDAARLCKIELEEALARPPSTPALADQQDLSTRSRTTLQSLGAVIESTTDASNLQEMLSLNDDITSLLARVSARRPELKRLKGLGIDVPEHRLSPEVARNGYFTADHVTSDEDDGPVTPRLDKGKQRAEPEPEVPEPVLSPTILPPEFEEEGEPHESLLGQLESIVSPTDR